MGKSEINDCLEKIWDFFCLTRWAVWGRIRVRSCNRQQLVSRKQWSLPEDWRCSALGSLTVGPPHSGGYFYFVWEVMILILSGSSRAVTWFDFLVKLNFSSLCFIRFLSLRFSFLLSFFL